MRSIEQASCRDDRGAVLIIMHDGDVHAFAQRLLDDETFGRGDIFQIDAAESRLHQRNRFDESVRVLGGEFDVDAVDIGEAFEQHRLAFHHRLGGQRAEITEAKNGGAVGDHRHQIGTRGVFGGQRRVLGNRFHRSGNTGRIGERKIALRCHRLGRDDFNFTGANGLVIEQRFAGGEAGVFFLVQGVLSCLSLRIEKPQRRG